MADRPEIDKELKRIFLKFWVLKIIADKPTHGYEIIQEIARKTEGTWTPSCGSIYPALDTLESNGWILSDDTERRKVYTITPEGRAALNRLIQEWYDEANYFVHIFGLLLEEKPGKDEATPVIMQDDQS